MSSNLASLLDLINGLVQSLHGTKMAGEYASMNIFKLLSADSEMMGSGIREGLIYSE
jgi:hypothetical protein